MAELIGGTKVVFDQGKVEKDMYLDNTTFGSAVKIEGEWYLYTHGGRVFPLAGVTYPLSQSKTLPGSTKVQEVRKVLLVIE